MKYTQPKYEPNQEVIVEGEKTKIVDMSYTNGEWFYKVNSKEVDLQAKEIIDGYKTVSEKEIKDVK